MGKIRALIGWWTERRQQNVPVHTDRRKPSKTGWKESTRSLDKAIDRLQGEIKRFNGENRVVANDIQQVVLFKTFGDICNFRNDALRIRLCRNPGHGDSANTALPRCEEEKCPLLLEALKGAAA